MALPTSPLGPRLAVTSPGPLQVTPSGTLPITPSGGGPIGTFLRGVGVPYAGTIGAVASFVVAFAVVYLAGRWVVLPLVERMLDARGLDRHAKSPLTKLTHLGIVFVAVAIAFGFAGLGNFLTSLATIAAAATLAIGFALQDVVKNFVSGVFIFTDHPFRIGDWIEWGDYSGVVEDISLRVTRVRTFDNELLTVPNAQLTDGVIKNPVAYDRLRVRFLFGIGYDDDVAAATELIVEAAEAHAEILDDPEPVVRLTKLGDSSVGLEARIWVADPRHADWIRIRSEFVADVKSRFDAADITIPFPQRELSGALALDGLDGGVRLVAED